MRNVAGLALALSWIACSSGNGTDDGGAPTDAAHRDDAAALDASRRDAPVQENDVGTDAATACGHCPDGTTCGTANGIAVCRTASGIPRFTSVTVIVMENTSLSTLAGATNTP